MQKAYNVIFPTAILFSSSFKWAKYGLTIKDEPIGLTTGKSVMIPINNKCTKEWIQTGILIVIILVLFQVQYRNFIIFYAIKLGICSIGIEHNIVNKVCVYEG